MLMDQVRHPENYLKDEDKYVKRKSTKNRTVDPPLITDIVPEYMPDLSDSVFSPDVRQPADAMAMYVERMLANQEVLNSYIIDEIDSIAGAVPADHPDPEELVSFEDNSVSEAHFCPHSFWTKVRQLVGFWASINGVARDGTVYHLTEHYEHHGSPEIYDYTMTLWRLDSQGHMAERYYILTSNDGWGESDDHWNDHAYVWNRNLGYLIKQLRGICTGACLRSVMRSSLETVSDVFNVDNILLNAGYTVDSLTSDAREFLNMGVQAVQNVKGMRPRAVVASLISNIFSRSSDSVADSDEGYSFTPVSRFAMKSVIQIPWGAIASTAVTVAGAIATAIVPIAGIAFSLLGTVASTVGGIIQQGEYKVRINETAEFKSYAYPVMQKAGTTASDHFPFCRYYSVGSYNPLNPNVFKNLNSWVVSTTLFDWLGWLSDPEDYLKCPTSVYGYPTPSKSGTTIQSEVHLKPVSIANYHLADLLPGVVTLSGSNPLTSHATLATHAASPAGFPLMGSLVGWTDDEVIRNGVFSAICCLSTCCVQDGNWEYSGENLEAMSLDPGSYRTSVPSGIFVGNALWVLLSVMIDHPISYGGHASMVVPTWDQIEGLCNLLYRAMNQHSGIYNDRFRYFMNDFHVAPSLPADGQEFLFSPPTLDLKTRLIAAGLAVALVAITTVTIVAVVRTKMKRTQKRTELYAKAQAAREAYQKNPSDKNLYKAYKKSVKANNWYSKFFGGDAINMTDGYLVGADATADADQSTLLERAMGVVNDLRGEPNEEAVVPEATDFSSLSRLITG